MEQEQRPTADAIPEDLDPPTAALASAVIDVDRFLGTDPVHTARWFALMGSARLLADNPGLAAVLGEEAAALLAGDDLHLTSIELEDVPMQTDPVLSLRDLAWPEDVDGLAVAFTLDAAHVRSPEPDDASAPGSTGSAEDTGSPSSAGTPSGLRAVVAALPDGTTFSAVQQDGQRHLALGTALIPEVTEALTDALTTAPGAD
jgi:hypothetical protein